MEGCVPDRTYGSRVDQVQATYKAFAASSCFCFSAMCSSYFGPKLTTATCGLSGWAVLLGTTSFLLSERCMALACHRTQLVLVWQTHIYNSLPACQEEAQVTLKAKKQTFKNRSHKTRPQGLGRLLGVQTLLYRFIMMSLMCVCKAMQISSPCLVSNWKMCKTPATRILKKTACRCQPLHLQHIGSAGTFLPYKVQLQR